MENRQQQSLAEEPMRREQAHAAGHQKAQCIRKRAENKLRKTLASPDRKEREDAFAAAHQRDSDQALYEYIKAQKYRLGKEMKPVNTIGYSYMVKRLGPWAEIMRRINGELEAEEAMERVENGGGDGSTGSGEKYEMGGAPPRGDGFEMKMGNVVLTIHQSSDELRALLSSDIEKLEGDRTSPAWQEPEKWVYYINKEIRVPLYRSFSDEELLEILRREADTLARLPTKRDVFCIYREFIIWRFKNWPSALEAAGLRASRKERHAGFREAEKRRLWEKKQGRNDRDGREKGPEHETGGK